MKTKLVGGPAEKVHAMVAAAEARVAASAISTILVAVAGAITLVSIAYAIFDALRGPMTPAGASAVTAFIFAMVTAALSVLGPKLIQARAARAKAKSAAAQPPPTPFTLRTGLEISVAIATALAETAWARRRRSVDGRHHKERQR